MNQQFELTAWFRYLLVSSDEIAATFLETLCGKEVLFTRQYGKCFLPPCRASIFFVDSPSRYWDNLRYRYNNLVTTRRVVDPPTYRTRIARDYGMDNYINMSSKLTLYKPQSILVFMQTFPDDARLPRLKYYRNLLGMKPMHRRMMSYHLNELMINERPTALPERVPGVLSTVFR